MALTIQQDYFTLNKCVIMFFLMLLVATNSYAQKHKIPEALTSHRNWKLLDRGDRCGQSAGSRIMGGQAVRLGQYPWIVHLGYIRNNDPYSLVYECGGSIISSRYILTAAHCKSNDGKELTQVRAGEHFTEEEKDCEGSVCAPPTQDIDIEEEICHPDWNSNTFQNDICLIRLKMPLTMNRFVSPICMPAFEVMLKSTFEGEKVVTAGWGLTETGTSSNVLLMLFLPVYDHRTCTTAYSKRKPIFDTQMCAGGNIGKDSCGGDSGGPLMKAFSANTIPRYFLLGVTSYGQTKCAQEALPGVYTVVSKYWMWILDSIRE